MVVCLCSSILYLPPVPTGQSRDDSLLRMPCSLNCLTHQVHDHVAKNFSNYKSKDLLEINMNKVNQHFFLYFFKIRFIFFQQTPKGVNMICKWT